MGKREIAALLLVIITLMAFPQQPAEAQNGILGYHTVQRGETIYCIARAYGVSPWEIALSNHLINVNLLHRGMILTIPATPLTLPSGPRCTPQFFSPYTGGAGACRWVYTVMRGDTLFSIGRRYGVDIWTLARYNGLLNPDQIKVGEVLCIP